MKLSSLRRIALYILFFSINFEIWDPLNTGGFLSISKLAGYFYFLTLIDQLPSFFKIRYIKRYLAPLLAFFLYLSIVNFVNINYISSIFIDFTILQNIILFIILTNHERKDHYILQKGMLCFAIGAVILAICFQLGLGVSSEAGRITIFGDNQNVIGVKEAIGSIILLLAILKNPLSLKRWRYAFLLFLPLMLLLMAQTGSRIAFFSFSLMFLVGLVLYKTKRSYTKVFILLLGFVGGMVIWQYLSESSILYSRLQLTEQNHDIGGRDRVWDVVVPFMEQNLIFGKGQSGYTEYITMMTGGFLSPHNVIFEIICYTGILGLFLFLLFLYRIFWISFRKYRADGSLIQLLLLIPILGLLLSGQILTVKICYIIFAFNVSGIFSTARLTPLVKRTKRRKHFSKVNLQFPRTL